MSGSVADSAAAPVNGLERPSRARPHFLSLTCLRFVAASAVVVFHFGQAQLTGAPRFVQTLAANGFVGVSFFFVLSGFILVYIYQGNERGMTVPRRTFWAARVARIYPLYLLSLLLSLPFYVKELLAHNTVGMAAVKGMLQGTAIVTMTQSLVPKAVEVWNFPAWSLSAEAFFYLLFPVIAFAISRRSRRWLILGVIVAWATSQVGPVGATWLLAQPGCAGRCDFVYPMVHYGAVFHLPQFILGALTGSLWLSRPVQSGKTTGLRWFALAVIVVVTLTVLGGSRIWGNTTANNGLFAPLFGLLIYSLASWEVSSSPRFPSFAVLLGDASYGIYILQVPVLYLLVFVRGARIDSFTAWLQYFVLLVAVSCLCFVYFETKARRVVASWLGRARPADVIDDRQAVVAL